MVHCPLTPILPSTKATLSPPSSFSFLTTYSITSSLSNQPFFFPTPPIVLPALHKKIEVVRQFRPRLQPLKDAKPLRKRRIYIICPRLSFPLEETRRQGDPRRQNSVVFINNARPRAAIGQISRDVVCSPPEAYVFLIIGYLFEHAIRAKQPRNRD
jgi:hypothetical protein